MYISVTGINHHTTPVSLRELYAFSQDDLLPALDRLPADFEGAAILSTCNRTELYLATDHAIEREAAVAGLAAAHGGPSPEGIVFYHYAGPEAVRHLYRVAAGIDSLVIGESEILGQVREAFSASTAAGTSNPVLARLFHTALRAARRARAETEIGAHGLSVSAMAVKLSRNALGSLRRKTVLVVGAGDAGQRAAAALAQAGAGRLLVTTRTPGRAEEIAAQLNGIALPFAELSQALVESDVVITATSAPEAVISVAAVKAALRAREGRPVVMVDIAVPRDIEPAVRDVAGVHLFDIDDLEALAARNLDTRRLEVEAVEAIVEAEARRFDEWLAARRLEPTIAALRRRAEVTRRDEVERTLSRIPALDDADRRRIEAMSKALVKRLLHAPMNRLRDGGSERHVDALRELFELDQEQGTRNKEQGQNLS